MKLKLEYDSKGSYIIYKTRKAYINLPNKDYKEFVIKSVINENEETFIIVQDKIKDILDEYIENIEQLGADARYYKNYEEYDRLLTQLESIEYWTKKAKKIVDKIRKEEKNEKDSI